MTDQQTGMSASRKQRFSTFLRFGLSILLFNLLVITMVVVSLQQSRRLYVERAEISTQNLAKVLEDSIEGVIEKIDLSLQHIIHGIKPVHPENRLNTKEHDLFIQQTHSLMPELEALRIADSQGNVILGTGVVKQVNLAGRPYFNQLRDDPTAGLLISPPFQSAMNGKWVLNIARRINAPDGSFGGIVYAQLTLDYFATLFSKLNIGRHGIVALRDGQLGLIIRYPDIKGPGSVIGQQNISPEFRITVTSQPVAGTYFTPQSVADNLPRTLSYRKISRYPLYVVVGVATSDYLEGWKKDSAKSLILLTVFTITTLLAAGTIYNRWRQQLELTDQLRQTKDQLELRVSERTTALEQEIGERQSAQEALASKHQQLEEINRTLEERVAHSVSELRSKDKLMIQQSRQAAMGEMINNIAHQWKQPLNNLGLLIQGVEYDFAAGLLTRADMKSESNKCMDLISYMSQTIDDFRSFFREDKQKTDFGVRQSITRAIQLVSASLKDRGIKIIVEAGEELLINGYPNEYAQVMLNLLGNARDVLIERAISDPLIKVEIAAKAGSAFVTISDNGGGIREEIIASIFDPYFTTKQQDKGSGIGLFMSKTIIEKHMGGSLTVCNRNDGACFTVAVALRTPEDVTGRSNSDETEHLEG